MEINLRVFTSFSGYDSQCMALDRLPLKYELVGWSEIDQYAIKAHNAVYPQWAGRNYGDISKIDWAQVPDFDLFTYSSPCQDFSQAGLQRGGEQGSGTRSSLLWECERAIAAKKPKYLLMENVAALVSSKFIKLFNKWQYTLVKMGYKNFAAVLNAKHYGVPQNRERVFLVSILDTDAKYEFAKPVKLEKRLKDVLEVDVDERYYLKIGRVDGANSKNHYYTMKAKPEIRVVGKLSGEKWDKSLDIMRRVYDSEGIAPTQHTAQGGNMETKICTPKYRIRKLTERECFRLMDVSESDIDKIQNAGISRTQQYKLAGNSIVVAVLVAIFNKLFIDTTISEWLLFY